MEGPEAKGEVRRVCGAFVWLLFVKTHMWAYFDLARSTCVSGWLGRLCSWTLSNGSGLAQTPRRSGSDRLYSALHFQFGKGNCTFISSNEGRVKGVATAFLSLPTCASQGGEGPMVFCNAMHGPGASVPARPGGIVGVIF